MVEVELAGLLVVEELAGAWRCEDARTPTSSRPEARLMRPSTACKLARRRRGAGGPQVAPGGPNRAVATEIEVRLSTSCGAVELLEDVLHEEVAARVLPARTCSWAGTALALAAGPRRHGVPALPGRPRQPTDPSRRARDGPQTRLWQEGAGARLAGQHAPWLPPRPKVKLPVLTL